MSFNLQEFTYIVSTVEDTLSMLDDAKISVSTTVIESDDEDSDENLIVLSLSFPLKNGFAEMFFFDDTGTIEYHGVTGDLLKEIDFNDSDVSVMNGSFNLALKGLITADKQNKQAKLTASVDSGDSEMNKLRAQLSAIS